MQAIAERAKQALGVGRDAGFVPSSLEPQQKTFEELSIFADPLRRMLTSAEHFKNDTAEFLSTTCSFVCDTPFPRLWTQVSPLEPAQALHTPVQAEHAAWFDAETHASLKLNVSDAVKYSLQRELLSPMKQWLLAYDVLKATLARLESRRLAYDADRRKLAAAAAKAQDAAAAESDTTGDDSSVGSSAAAAAVVEVAQLQENAASASPVLSEFEADVEALDDGLSWLVSGALRLKALIADTAGGVAVAASNWQIPPGLMPTQEPSTFGEGYEVTMTVTDAPGVEKLLGTEAPPQATTSTPELTDATQSSSTGDDVGSKVEVGGTTPSGDDHHLISDEESFDTAASGSSDDGDDRSFEDQPIAAAAEGGGSSILGRIKHKVTQLIGHKGQGDRDTAAAAGAAAAAEGDDAVDPIDPHELMSDRPSRTYSGGGVGQVEARLSDAGSAGVGAAGRHLRDKTGGAAALHTGLAATPQVGIPDADKKQLSTVVLPASPTAAAAAADTRIDDTAATTTDTNGADSDIQHGSSSSGGDKPSAGGGLFAAIHKTLQEGKALVTGQQEPPPPQQQQNEEQQSEEQQQRQDEEQQNEEQQREETAVPTAATEGDSTEHEGHVAPVTPHLGHVAAPQSADYVEGPTPPSGTVAATAPEPPVAAVEQSPSAVLESPSAAAEAPAGSADSPPSTAGAPDLSKILSSSDKSPTGVPSSPPLKPSGGGVGAFLRDTILGPKAAE